MQGTLDTTNGVACNTGIRRAASREVLLVLELAMLGVLSGNTHQPRINRGFV